MIDMSGIYLKGFTGKLANGIIYDFIKNKNICTNAYIFSNDL